MPTMTFAECRALDKAGWTWSEFGDAWWGFDSELDSDRARWVMSPTGRVYELKG